MSEHASRPLGRPFLSRGTYFALALILIALFFAARRFIWGIGSVTNLDDQYPWGLWIAFDVATGVALAAGGFTTAALVHIFGKERFHAVLRPALLTAALGYTFVALGLLADLGRYWAIWHPMMPSMWQGDSVLFEVGICVMSYLTVLYIEFAPIVMERIQDSGAGAGLRRLASGVNRILDKLMFLFVIAGVVLSCLHQSSLGNLMVIAPSKMSPLWYTPLLPLLFLLSAIAVGFPMVIFESWLASRAFGRDPETHIMGPLSRYAAGLIGLYLAFKLGDLTLRGAWGAALVPSWQAAFFWVEMLVGLALPVLLFIQSGVRHSPRLLFLGSACYVIAGVALNRLNVFMVAYRPPYADQPYFPAVGEWAISIGLVATLVLVYRLAVLYLPVLPVEEVES